MDGSAFTIVIIIWLIIITAVLVIFGIGVSTHRIDFGPTGAAGPTGPSGGPIGPTGPTGPSITTTTTTTTLQTVPIQSQMPLMAIPSPITTTLLSTQAQCFPCQFTNQGFASDFQSIPAGKPSIIRWILNTNTLNASYQDATFILQSGTYMLAYAALTTSVAYPSINAQGGSNSGGTYRSAAVWLRDINANN